MTNGKLRKLSWALVALVLILAACKGESPTSPSSTGGGGGTTPPSGSSVAISFSNPNPQVNSNVTVTVTVTVNGQPAANGTAVELSATQPGVFTDTSGQATLKTTTGGVATAVITATTAGTVTVQAVVNNAIKTGSVTFSIVTVVTPPDTAPAITSVTPATGRPQGGQQVTITGRNFRSPVRVLFDLGSGTPKEAFVVSSTPNQIVVLTPAIDLGPTAQSATANIIVQVESGTANQVSVTQTGGFRYQIDILTPSITTVSPASGPIEGGTRITIVGENFQSPVQVFFGGAAGGAGGPLASQIELQVVNVTFNQIIAVTPAFRSTDSSITAGQVTLRVLNINSNKDATLASAFRYLPQAHIDAVAPTDGIYSGGTRVELDGVGFVDPVAVVIGGVAAQPISIAGTKIIAITGALQPGSCADAPGPITVTNIDSGTTTQATIQFIYRVPKPTIIAVSPNVVQPGNNVSVTVANPGLGIIKFQIGDRTVFPSGSVTNASGTVTYTIAVPTNFTFNTGACTVGGLAGNGPQPLLENVSFLNVTTTCPDLATNALTINPPGGATCTVTPPSATITTPANAACLTPSTVVGTPTTGVISISNGSSASSNLTINTATISGPAAGDYTISPVTPPVKNVAPGAQINYTVTFNPTTTGTRNATATFTTNDPNNPVLQVCINGTGN